MAKFQLKRWGGGKLCKFPTNLICFNFAYYFILILYLSNCLIRCVCKKSFLSFSYFSMVTKKICKIKTNLSEIRKALPPPPPPFQLHSRHCICVAIFIISESQSEKLWHQNYKLRPQNYKLHVQTYKFDS